MPREILWGYRFNDVLHVKKKYYKVDCLQFEETTEVYAPHCSAMQLDRKEQEWNRTEKMLEKEAETSVTEIKSLSENQKSFSAVALITSCEDPEDSVATVSQPSGEASYQKAAVTLSRLSLESQI